MALQDEAYSWWVGIDWATQAHEVVIVDAHGRPAAERSVAHTGGAIGEFIEWLVHLADGRPERVAVGIEIPRGAIVDTLVERGVHVYALNPKQLDRFRDRHTVAGAKDDRRDAFVLATSLRTDRPAFRRVRLEDAVIIELREYSRMDDDLRDELSRLTNRLRDQLHRFFPQMLELVPAADEPWLWTLLEAVPTPQHVPRVPRRRIEKLLGAHRIRRFDTETILATLRTQPLPVAPGTVEAARAHVAFLLPRLRLVREQRARCEQHIEALLARLEETEAPPGQSSARHDVQILRSLVGVGVRVAGIMFAEAAPLLAERDYQALRSHSGIAPVTHQSGKRKQVVMRHACNGRLREAVYHWARTSVQHDERSAIAYAAARGRGHTHGRALRSVADRLLRILIAMLKAGTLYDPHRFTLGPGRTDPANTGAGAIRA
ncbi:MAG TPA: IS110 family transposase [Gemmatimonadales bacterium]